VNRYKPFRGEVLTVPGTPDAALSGMAVLNPVILLLTLVFAAAFVGLDRLVRWFAIYTRAFRASPRGRHRVGA
jgi:hypothetical protein